MKDEMS